MGIEITRVGEHPQLEDLTCAICQEIFDLDTKSGKDCDHCFCKTCIDKWLERKNTCPTCNSRFIPKETHRFLRATLEKLMVKCKFCTTVTKYENLNQHEKNCNGRVCMIRDGCKMRMVINHNTIEGCVGNLKACLQHANQLDNCSAKICQQKCIFLKEIIPKTKPVAPAEVGQLENRCTAKTRKQAFLNGLQLHECRMLYQINYKRDIESKYQNLKVTIEMNNRCIKYLGFHEEIEEAKRKAVEIIREIRVIQYICEPIERELMTKFESELVAWLRANKLVCVIDFMEQTDVFYIYGMNNDDIKRCGEKLSDYIVTRKYVLDNALKRKFDYFIQTEEDRKKRVGYKKLNCVYFQNNKTFTVCGFKDDINEFLKRIDDLIY